MLYTVKVKETILHVIVIDVEHEDDIDEAVQQAAEDGDLYDGEQLLLEVIDYQPTRVEYIKVER